MQIEKLVPKGVLPPLIRMNRAFGYMALAKCAAHLQQPVAVHRYAHCSFGRRKASRVDCADRHRGQRCRCCPAVTYAYCLCEGGTECLTAHTVLASTHLPE